MRPAQRGARLLGLMASALVMLAIGAPLRAHDSGRMLGDESLRWAAQQAALQEAGLTGDQLAASRAVLKRSWLWHEPTLTMCFGPSADVDGDLAFVRRVRDVAREWLAGAVTQFDFGDDRLRRCDAGGPRSHIRVWVTRRGSETYLGMLGNTGRNQDITSHPGYSVVLSFPAPQGRDDFFADPPLPNQVNWRFYVLHEFGHALGFMHEHQRVDCGFNVEWLQTRRNPPFTPEFVRSQMRLVGDPIASQSPDTVFQTGGEIGSGFDRHSVMQYYEADASAFVAGRNSPCFQEAPVVELSEADRLTARVAYDGTGRTLLVPPTGTPILEPLVAMPGGGQVVLSDDSRRAILRALALR
ncbi:MAG TPA: hypothetical protein VGM87_09400 [Roseomonas sp.]|jgi:hypothetical protein